MKNDNAEVFLDSTSSVFRKSSVRVSVMKQGSVNSAQQSRVQCAGSHPGATAGLSLKKAWCTPPPKGGAVGVWCSREVLDDLL